MARSLFPEPIRNIRPAPQSEVLQIGLRKGLLGGKTDREVEIPPRGFFGLEDPASSQISLKAFGGKDTTIWLCPTQAEEKRESHSPDLINPLGITEIGKKNVNPGV